ncbi:MAG: histidine phosphatase family protein [Victivallales bacterium]|nr:histidine phosphatase family protein [Victivallales bacterium]
MYLYIIRHGKPDYATDSLLPEGWEQARAVAKRLKASGIDEIHASPMGRAQETAQPTSELLNLPIITEPWAYELGEESHTTYPDGQSRTISALPSIYMLQKAHRGLDLEESLDNIEGFHGRGFKKRYHAISDGLDGMLSKLGYARNGDGFYDTISPNHRHVALFCHAGMMRVMLSHLFHIPYQFVAGTLQTNFTGVTIVHFAAPPYISVYERPDVKYTAENLDEIPAVFPVMPSLISYGDVGHLYADGHAPVHYLNLDEF